MNKGIKKLRKNERSANENSENYNREYSINMEKNKSTLDVVFVKTDDLYSDIVSVIDSSYSLANKTVNYILIQRNWLIGKRIVETELTNRKDDYGKSVIKELSKKLTQKYGCGFESRNIYYFIDFYNSFPNILHTVRANSLLTWSHYKILLQVNDDDARKWYADEASREMWSVRTLQRNISSQYYNRMISSLVKDQVHNEMIEFNTINQQNKLDYIKDPMILEFLGFSENNAHLESNIENAIINHLQKFLIELGKGYAFVGRQQRIHTTKEDYFIDLVFYNYILKCFVLIDLKTSKITHQDVGQMDMYIKMYDELRKSSDDNPTLGIVLCSDTDEDIARYSILNGNEQLFASKYKLYLPTEKELKEEIEKEKTFYLEKTK